MDNRHERLRTLFDDALGLDPARRSTFLDTACRGDSQMRRRLDAMLIAVEDERFLASPTGPRLGGVRAAPSSEAPGIVIGPYKLLEQIGEGGFGTVWMAEQREPVKRRVALKILKLGMDTEQVVARFDQERQALALMDHPNIARVLDAGATATGRPYFVMELVKGVPVLEYCDTHRLDTRARLALFLDICRAIQHAHHKGIIHRDIKPSNVLVTLHDSRPVPKVIDFGIAKATHAEISTRTLFTEHRQMIGTPAYMSPEQAEMSGVDIDTRSDVYSLGVLLYELLTGTTPFDIRELLEVGFEEMLRTIREVDPHKPSTRVSSLQDTALLTAQRRNLDVKRLGTALRGDLDWIVMRCLEKDRTRRYETASSLALDIQRHLDGETVLAAPPSAGYRMRKAIRRNRRLVAAGSVVALALIIGLASTLWQARVAAHERDVAKAETLRADARARELEEVSSFQARMLEGIDAADAGVALLSELRARHAAALSSDTLDDSERAARVQSFTDALGRVNASDVASSFIDHNLLSPAVRATREQFADQPLVDAALRQTLATLYVRLGRDADALPLQEFAVQTRKSVLGERDVDTLRSLNDMGCLLEQLNRNPEAEECYRAALAGRREVLGPEHPDTLSSLSNLGNYLRVQTRFAEAEPLLREAVEVSRRVRGEEHRDTLIATNTLGYLLIDQGRYPEAEVLWRECYEKGRRALGKDDPDAIVWTNNLGGLLSSLGRPAESESYYREALESARRVHGEEHPATLLCVENVALSLQAQGRYPEAEQVFRAALEGRTRVLGSEHLDTIDSFGALGGCLSRQGRLSEAEPYLRKAYEADLRVLGARNLETLRSGAILASFLRSSGAFDEAESLFREVLATSREVLGEEHPDTLVMMNNFGNLLSERDRLAEAEPILRAALEARRRVSGDDHPETLIVQSSVGRLLEEQGKLAEAEGMYRDATERFRRVLGERHPNTNASIANLAGVVLAQGRAEESLELWRSAIAGYEAALGKDHARTGGAQLGLGRALTKLARFEEAQAALLEAERVLSAAEGVSESRKARCREALVELYEAWHAAQPGQGHDVEAERWR